MCNKLASYTLLTIPIENIFWLLGFHINVQNISLFSMLALVSLVIIGKRLSISSSIRKILLFYFLCLLSIGQILFFNEAASFQDISNTIRQLVSLTLGVVILVFLEYIFQTSNSSDIVKGMESGFWLIFTFSVFDFVEQSRVKATYTEPSHLAIDLVLIYLPFFMYFRDHFSKRHYMLLMFCLFAVLILTYSTTGFLLLFIFIIFYILFEKSMKRRLLLLFLLIASVLTSYVLFFVILPDNYLSKMVMGSIQMMVKGSNIWEMPLSLTDRLQFWIMISQISLSSLIDLLMLFFGSGLGMEKRMADFMPQQLYYNIASIKSGSMINSIAGKLFVYTGLTGLLLWFGIFFVFFKIITKQKGTLENRQFQLLMSVLSVVMVLCTFGSLSFQNVALWFWFAFIDSIQKKVSTKCSTSVNKKREPHLLHNAWDKY